MGAGAIEFIGHLVVGQGASRIGPGQIAGMPGNGRVKAGKRAALGHKRLAGAAFLAGTAKIDYRARQLLFFHLSLHTENAAHTGNAKKVVTAALTCAAGNDGLLMCADLLAHAGQSVILAQDTDDRMSLAPCCLDGCGKADISDFYVKTIALKSLGDPLAGIDFVICCFGMLPDLLCKSCKILFFLVDRAVRSCVTHNFLSFLLL
mgnify:CR=1 FL=1